MTKYCPTCESEYKDHVIVCPDDNTPLADKPIEHPLEVVAIDIYAAANEIEGERIVSLLLAEGIQARLNRVSISQYPVASDKRFFILVPKDDKNKAVQAIKDARQDGVIPPDGVFI